MPAQFPQNAAQFREEIRQRALDLGFSRVGFTTADPLDEATQRRWRRWLDRNVAGEMDYLTRPHPSRTHPRDLMPSARTVIVVTEDYYRGDHDPLGPGQGRIARYAWGEDYHGALRGRLGGLARWIESQLPSGSDVEPFTWRAFTDSAPIDERSLAVRAGLGFFGKNTLLLDAESGSWTLLAELFLSIALPPDEPQAPGQCGSCRKCLDACPTGAFTGPYELDPRRCISYLTIEQRGPIPEEIVPKMNGWAFGCDICQEVCPFNESVKPLARVLSMLKDDGGAGRVASPSLWKGITSKKGFQREWAASPISRPGLDGMKRNLAAALASIASAETGDATTGKLPDETEV